MDLKEAIDNFTNEANKYRAFIDLADQLASVGDLQRSAKEAQLQLDTARRDLGDLTALGELKGAQERLAALTAQAGEQEARTEKALAEATAGAAEKQRQAQADAAAIVARGQADADALIAAAQDRANVAKKRADASTAAADALDAKIAAATNELAGLEAKIAAARESVAKLLQG